MSDDSDFEELEAQAQARNNDARSGDVVDSKRSKVLATPEEKLQAIRKFFNDEKVFKYTQFLFLCEVEETAAEIARKRGGGFFEKNNHKPKKAVLDCYVDFFYEVLKDARTFAAIAVGSPQLSQVFVVTQQNTNPAGIALLPTQHNLWLHDDFSQYLFCLLCDVTHNNRVKHYTTGDMPGAIYILSGQAAPKSPWCKFAAEDYQPR
jgi:hypothetical protein